ncbi:DUF6397 family protein [Streptomyces sp. CAU 1734]|uniref:DUF6397 family protein n=1 Tax=Streptomyces sp. CAU 1734 TaxID=3140360 RepID=UPI0032601381
MAVQEHMGRAADARMAGSRTMTPAAAARLLGLKQAEFDLAVQLGHLESAPAAHGGPWLVPGGQIQRLCDTAGAVSDLREQVRTVGSADGARLLGVGPERFTRLARAGCLTPVSFHVNRYHAVVWRYVAVELSEFARRRPELLSGRTPPVMRALLGEGEDRRAANWRSRRVELLLRVLDEPWERAAVIATALDSASLAEAVPDARERHCLRVRAPEFSAVRPLTPGAGEVVARLLLADDPAEILRYRSRLVSAVLDAREECPALWPGEPAGTSGAAWGETGPVPAGRYRSEGEPGRSGGAGAAGPAAERGGPPAAEGDSGPAAPGRTARGGFWGSLLTRVPFRRAGADDD